MSILTVLPPFLFRTKNCGLLISTISLWTKLESVKPVAEKLDSQEFIRHHMIKWEHSIKCLITQLTDREWLIISSSWQLGPWPEWKTIITLSEVFARIAQQPSLLFKIVKSKYWTRAYHRVIAGWVTRKTKTKWKWKNMKTFLK